MLGGDNKRRSFHLLVGATLTIGTAIVGSQLTSSLTTGDQSWWIRLGWLAAGIAVTFFYLRWQLRSQEESPEAIKERVTQLHSELRKQVQARSYGARSNLIEAPLRQLDLDITPRLGWVRDPRLVEPAPVSDEIADDIVAAFESSKRRLLIVGEPGSGKTIAAYSLIEYLDCTEGDERIPLLVNLSAWEAQENFETYLVDYLSSLVGYQVRERAVASAFIGSDRYALILDGLDEIPAGLGQQFSERLDEFVRELPGEVGVVVTCRTQEYEQLLAAHPAGLGLVQAVEILPLTSEQLDSAFVELAKGHKDWELFLSRRYLTAYRRVRQLLSNPLFLNLAVVGHLSPSQLLDWTTTEQELRDFVLESYLDRTLIADQRHYEPEAARRYLSWIARFLNGDEVSPFGLKTSDYTVFDLADLTPPDPPWRYRWFGGLAVGLVFGLVTGLGGILLELVFGPGMGLSEMLSGLVFMVLVLGLVVGLLFALLLGLQELFGWHLKRSAVSSRLTLVWPSTSRQLLDFLRTARRGLGLGLLVGMVLGLFAGMVLGLFFGLAYALVYGLVLGLFLGMVFGLLESRSVLITSRTPKEASSRSVIAALTWLVCGLLGVLVASLSLVLGGWLLERLYRGTMERLYSEIGYNREIENVLGGPIGLVEGLVSGLFEGLVLGMLVGLFLALRNGGWFVVLQKFAHRRLARAGNFPPNPYEFLEWGVEGQIFRRVGGGVRFRHNLIQQHLANTSEGVS